MKHGRPEIFNTDQGSQYTADQFTSLIESHGARMSMDGRGRAIDNVFVERLWRSVKYEEPYIKEYVNAADLICSISRYFDFYNNSRLHQGLGGQTPATPPESPPPRPSQRGSDNPYFSPPVVQNPETGSFID